MAPSCCSYPPPRVRALDLARALGVIAMVFGHTCDALLSPAARAAPIILTYWKARGLTAPLFMMASGWAVTLALPRAPARGLEMIKARLPRVILLLALGYGLRLPGWNLQALLAGDRATWQHLLAFDALHVIAVGFLIAVLILASTLGRLEQGLLFALLAAAAMALGMRLPPQVPRTLPALALAQAVGGTSPFPVFPWVAYFFFGAAFQLLTDQVRIRCGVALVFRRHFPGGVGVVARVRQHEAALVAVTVLACALAAERGLRSTGALAAAVWGWASQSLFRTRNRGAVSSARLGSPAAQERPGRTKGRSTSEREGLSPGPPSSAGRIQPHATAKRTQRTRVNPETHLRQPHQV